MHQEKRNLLAKISSRKTPVIQLQEKLQKVAICDEWVEKFLKKVNEWEKEKNYSSQSFVQNLERKIHENQEKLDKFVSGYIDGDIPKESYLKTKEELMKEKLYLNQQKQNFGQKGKNWIEHLRRFILDTKKANKLAFSDNFYEIKEFVRKIGTNPKLLDKSISFSFYPPFDFLAKIHIAKFDKLGNVDPRGIEPRIPRCHRGVLPVYYGPKCP